MNEQARSETVISGFGWGGNKGGFKFICGFVIRWLRICDGLLITEKGRLFCWYGSSKDSTLFSDVSFWGFDFNICSGFLQVSWYWRFIWWLRYCLSNYPFIRGCRNLRGRYIKRARFLVLFLPVEISSESNEDLEGPQSKDQYPGRESSHSPGILTRSISTRITPKTAPPQWEFQVPARETQIRKRKILHYFPLRARELRMEETGKSLRVEPMGVGVERGMGTRISRLQDWELVLLLLVWGFWYFCRVCWYLSFWFYFGGVLVGVGWSGGWEALIFGYFCLE